MSDKSSQNWTFLSNHGHTLIAISRNPELKVAELAKLIGITERSVLSILSDLEVNSYITVERIGRRNNYKINSRKKFRHPSEADHAIGELLEIFST